MYTAKYYRCCHYYFAVYVFMSYILYCLITAYRKDRNM